MKNLSSHWKNGADILNLPTVILAFLYFVTGKLTLSTLNSHTIITAGMFPPEGIALAFVIYFGRKVWPGIFVGQFLLAVSGEIGFLPALMISTVNTLEALLGLWLFRRLRLDPALKSVKDILGFSTMVLLVLQPFSSILGNLILWVFGSVSGSSLPLSIFWWWFGNSTAQLLLTPFILQLFLLPKPRSRILKEYLYYGGLFALFLYLLESVFSLGNHFLLFSLTIPLVVFVIAKKGMEYGMLLGVVAAIVAFCSINQGGGPFQSPDPMENTINFNLYLLAYLSTILTTGVLFEERRNFEKILHERIRAALEENREQQLQIFRQKRHAQMGEILSMIAHQWRQPLNNLSLINHQLLSRFKTDRLDKKTMEQFIVSADRQIRLMSDTIDDFRDFLRGERPQFYELTDVIEKVAKMIEPIYASNRIELKLHLPNRCPLFGPSNALAQAILNILNNAGDILADKKEGNRIVEIFVDCSNEKKSIEIVDNGGGIPEHLTEKIFEPYFSTKTGRNGTGLGLYMSKMIVEEHPGGEIRVENAKEGARFVITLNSSTHENSGEET